MSRDHDAVKYALLAVSSVQECVESGLRVPVSAGKFSRRIRSCVLDFLDIIFPRYKEALMPEARAELNGQS